jgi:serine/threonine-protein kinase
MIESTPPSLEGTVVAGRFRVERLIGRGGMGSVWAGRHLTLGQMVAIKFISPRLASSRDALRRFDNEAKAAARIESRHAVRVYDNGVTEAGDPYIVMEYLDGESLEQYVERRGPLPLSEVTRVITQAARALEAAHAAGVVHRDLKPDNIFLARDPDSTQGYIVKIVDFGIAKLLHDPVAAGGTQAGTIIGTPNYMSPEALMGTSAIGPASDVWSLGACAFAAACARVPFEGDAIGDVVMKVCAAPLPVPSSFVQTLSRAFDTWFSRACAREPAQRFGSIREMSEALEQLDTWVSQQREVTAYEIRPAQPSYLEADLDLPRASSRSTLLAGMLGGIALTIGALGWYVMQRTREANEVILRSAEQTAAVVEAQNEATRRKAEDLFWRTEADAGAETDAAATGKPRVR